MEARDAVVGRRHGALVDLCVFLCLSNAIDATKEDVRLHAIDAASLWTTVCRVKSKSKDAAQYPGPVTFISVLVRRPLRVMTALLWHRMSPLRPICSMFPIGATVAKSSILKQFVGHGVPIQSHA